MINFGRNKYIVTDEGSVYKKPGIARTVAAIAAGSAAAGAAVYANDRVIGSYMASLMNKANKIDMEKEMQAAFDASKLGEKGVKILDAAVEKPNIKNMLPDWCKKMPKTFQNALETTYRTYLSLAKEGKNAFFSVCDNSIHINPKKLSIASFQEMGHALNYHMSKATRCLQKMRPLGFVYPIITATALLKRKKVEGEQQKGIFDKATDFIKNNCGKLTVLAFLPMLAEKGLATLRGEALAKKAGMSPDKLKTLKSFNRKAYLSYLAVAASVSAGTVIGSKLRDKIAEPKVVE